MTLTDIRRLQVFFQVQSIEHVCIILPDSLLAEGGPHAPPTGELLGYFLVAMGLFYRKKHVNIEITCLRGTYFKHF